MNYFMPGLIALFMMIQIYQYFEILGHRYHITFSHMQVFSGIYLLGFCCLILTAKYHFLVLIIISCASIATYHKEHGFLRKCGWLVLLYGIAIGCYQVLIPYTGTTNFYASWLLFLGIAQIIMMLYWYFLYHNRYDQMYIYVCFLSLLCVLFLLVNMMHRQLLNEHFLFLVMQLLMIMTGSFYRICFCLEVGKEKGMLALNQTYVMEGNQKRYEAIQKENQYIMKNLHDLKKHMDVLEHMDHTNENVQRYKEEIQEKSKVLLQYQKTGDTLIDKILQQYHPKFMEAHIQCNIESEPIDYRFMDAIDVCALLCNMLDNAYESCLKCEDRFILLKMRKVHDKVIWKMKNAVKERVMPLKTSKQQSFAHGFGMQNIADIAKKYQGDLISELDAQQGVFTTAVFLYITDDVENDTSSA